MTDSKKMIAVTKDKGLCKRCGKPRMREGIYCNDCLIKERERHKKDNDFFREIGICYMCRTRKLFGDEKICPECSAKNYSAVRKRNTESIKEYEKKYAARRKELRQQYYEKGICYNCKKRRIEVGKKKCRVCLDKDTLAHKNKYVPIRETGVKNGLCYQCVKEPATNGKLCKKCYDKAVSNLEKGRMKSEYASKHRLIMQSILKSK